ncbi:PREDICTED: uncharacterized protein LOC108362054 [Rhagoletis zephyria]|uniref:uncharacterized protein LOC108362054 n=1 Tax=Rhagoletis zephyria TaxID=28612 RepID=UPI0008112F83|nr:PREDICTED: uncharacterized protein LOC108362054 [Rhagoletis zephyria]
MSSLKIRDSALNAIKRYLQSSKVDALSVDTEVISTYLQLLEEQWTRFCEAQQEVELSCGDENASMEEQSRIQGEEWYSTAKANLKRLLSAQKQPSHQTSVKVAPTPTPLPKLQLPSFNGDPTQWLSFHDAFCSLVNANANLSNGQKLHYLRNCLKGEALDLVSSLAVCDSNYNEAWDLLTARYKVMRVMVDSHIKALSSIEKATKDTAKAIKHVLNAILQHVGALRALGRPVEFWDDWLIHLTVSKLAYETRKQWELSLVIDDLPSFTALREFLETRARSLEMVPQVSASTKTTKNVLHTACSQSETRDHTSAATKVLHCAHCNGDHKIYTCPQFSQLDSKGRLSAVNGLGACVNCLSKGHVLSKCRSASSCRICQHRHHTLLHANFPNQTATPASSSTGQPVNVTSHHADADRVILLATAEIVVQDYAGRWQPARALLDNGSHASFVTEACVQRLRIPRTPSSAFVTGIGSLQGGRTKGEVTLCVSPRTLDTKFQVSTLILPTITNDLPTTPVPTSSWPHLTGLPLADLHFSKPGPVDILIGMDEMEKILLSGLRKGEQGTPMAQNTAFGWVLFGNATNLQRPPLTVSTLHCDTQLTQLINKFWELEELPPRRFYTPEESFCEKLFDETTERAEDGRYIVRLPLKTDVVIGESRAAAVRALLRMEKRFSTNKHLRQEYSKFMQELIDMGHMELAEPATTNVYYMPHHAVLKNTSETTKLRVVFNASMRTSSGNSLNDALMVGPQLQQDLFSVLTRFRTHRFGIIADVEKMYRQVYVAKQDTDYQRIVWRENPSQPMSDYRLLRVTYGVASASHLAVKSLQQAALNATNTSKRVVEVVKSDFYMDDLLTGADTIRELTVLQKDVSSALSQSGFELRKWATNCQTLRELIPHASKQISHLLADGDEIRTLGTTWHTNNDWLSIAVNQEALPSKLTKRTFLSDSSKIFDPLGLIAPCTIRSKIWLQRVWRLNVDWDEPVPSDVAKDWLTHRSELSKLSSLKLNRWLGTSTVSDSEFHVFTDASEVAYAAALYCRTQVPDGKVKVILVAAKTKVAPLKTTSLPRLELCAAHLGAKLVRQVQSSLNHSIGKLYAWTDSMVALAWLQSNPSRWAVFVANRVADVQEVLPASHWRHVASEHNPADCASRGITPSQLLAHPLWWHGPPWLREGNSHWLISAQKHTTELELKSKKTVANLTQTADEWDLLTKYHSFDKLKRITAYLLRFANNARITASQSGAGALNTGCLTCAEIRSAEVALVKYTQFNCFEQEIYNCRFNKPVPMRSSLARLQPFLDSKGILRVGGRIKNAVISDDVKHPIILPKKSPLAKVIAAEIHITTLHGGPQIMQAVLQRRFWVPGIRNLVRGVYRHCTRCRRLSCKPIQQLMADLPASRVTATRCFLHSAVDFAGPYALKFTHGRGAKSTKAYICSFICMSTGAMHLELAGDLSSITFIAAFKRFTNRRGYCQHIYSDNGTNFVGAEKELRIAYERCINDDKVSTYFADAQTTWHFNPPSAPHMGGFWEAGIKRVKYHLKRALGPSHLTYEEFATVLTEVEACVNSRPICCIPTEVNDLEVLTPGHFIVGEPLKALPDPDVEVFKGTIFQRWQLIASIRQHFWKRWRDEYLVRLQQRSKWLR